MNNRQVQDLNHKISQKHNQYCSKNSTTQVNNPYVPLYKVENNLQEGMNRIESIERMKRRRETLALRDPYCFSQEPQDQSELKRENCMKISPVQHETE